MSTIELKTNILKIVENIQNEQLLQTLYDFLKSKKKSESGKLWESLTDEQKNEVLLAFKESEDENNLIEVMKFLNRPDENLIYKTSWKEL